MERNVNYALVGLFVSIVTIAGLVFALWLARSYEPENNDYYTVLFSGAINGLAEGSIVRYRGVEVGNVIDIRLDEKNPKIIKVDIEIIAQTPISRNSSAKLKPQGITGISFIELSTPDLKGLPPKGEFSEPYPVIRGEESGFDVIIRELPELAHQAGSVLKRLEGFLSSENAERLSNIIVNLDNASTKINLGLDEVQDLPEKVAIVLDDAHDLVLQIENTLNGLDETFEEAKSAVPELKESLENIRETSQSIRTIITANEGHINKFADQGLSELTAFLSEARDVLENTNSLIEKIEENPSQFVYQPNGYGVEIKP